MADREDWVQTHTSAETLPASRISESLRRMGSNRPQAPVPPELWAVIGLLALAGALLLHQTLPLLADVLEFAFSSDPLESLGLFFAVLFVEIALLGVVLLALAYALYCGDASGRLTAAVLCGALSASLLLQHPRTSTDKWIMLLSLGIATVLSVAPATREWFGSGLDQGEPPTITTARSISSVMAVALGMVGIGMLPAVSFEGVFAFVGAGLCVASVLILRNMGPIRTGDADARNVLSGLMTGYIILLLLARTEASAEALVVPIALAAAVIGLLWLPPASQVHFGRDPADAALPRALSSLLTTAPPRGTLRPPVFPRRPAQPVFHDLVAVQAGSKRVRSSVLQMTYDQESWFPVPAEGERVTGVYLVAMVLDDVDGSPESRVFQGTSTLLVTDRRLAGVCPKGTGPRGRLDANSGPVVVWSVPLDALAPATEATSTSGDYLSLGQAGYSQPWIRLAKPRVLTNGTFVPVDLRQLTAAIRPSSARSPGRASSAPSPLRPTLAQPGERRLGTARPPSGSVAITAKQRSRTALCGDTSLQASDVLTLIKTACGAIKGGGASLLTTGLRNIGAQVNVESESPTALRLSLTSGKRLVDLCSFSATLSTNGSGRTTLRVGGLDSYRTQQQKLLYLIPAGPKQILGMAPYKRFLELTAELILEADPSARLSISSVADTASSHGPLSA